MARDIAIDLHRRSLFVVIAEPDGTELLRRRFSTSVEGEAQMLLYIQPGDRVVLEATTGSYRLANRLEGHGAQAIVADPQHSRLVGMRGKKTDYRDCLALLQLLRAGTLIAVWRPDAPTRETRQLARERQAYNQSIVRLKNRIHSLLWEEGLYCPSNLWTDEGQHWLSAQPIRPAARAILERELRALRALEDLKAEQERELAQRVATNADAQRLMQIVGFGTVNSQMFTGEVGDANRFPTEKQIVSYAGLDPRTDESGDQSRRGPISKAGRRVLRTIMIDAAWTHVNQGAPEAHRFHRMVKRGKAAQVAITALARHLLVIAYRMLTRGENYRGLVPSSYEGKLAPPAAFRPDRQASGVTNVAWAAQRFEEMTGLASPYRQARIQAQEPASRCAG